MAQSYSKPGMNERVDLYDIQTRLSLFHSSEQVARYMQRYEQLLADNAQEHRENPFHRLKRMTEMNPELFSQAAYSTVGDRVVEILTSGMSPEDEAEQMRLFYVASYDAAALLYRMREPHLVGGVNPDGLVGQALTHLEALPGQGSSKAAKVFGTLLMVVAAAVFMIALGSGLAPVVAASHYMAGTALANAATAYCTGTAFTGTLGATLASVAYLLTGTAAAATWKYGSEKRGGEPAPVVKTLKDLHKRAAEAAKSDPPESKRSHRS